MESKLTRSHLATRSLDRSAQSSSTSTSTHRLRHTERSRIGIGVFVVLVAGLLAACGAPPPAGPMLSGPIVIFDIDTLRADHLGCYGYERPTSPNIDAMARESYRFEWAFSQAPETGPSHGSIFTGLYPSTHGARYNGALLPESATTLAEVFRDAGYSTTAFVDGGYMVPYFGLTQGFETVHEFEWKGLDTIGPHVIDWLRDHADENFFLLIHTYDVHADYTAPEPYRSFFTEGMTPTPGFVPTVKQLEVYRRSQWTEQPLQLSPADLAYTKARYDGGIRFADDWIGLILDEMRSLGLDRRATTVLYSDHGEAFQEQGTLMHDRLYAPVTHIPLIIRPPGGTTGTVYSSIVQGVDLMPTLLEGAGIPVPPALQGRSLMPLLRGEDFRQLPAFSESAYFGNRHAVFMGDYHLITALENDIIELFDFRRDPLELRDISAERPQTVAELLALTKRRQEEFDRRGRPLAEEPTLDEKTIKNLQALGYMQ